MTTYVLMISDKFPKDHIRSGEPTNFPLSIKYYDKIHTLRGNYQLWKKRFDKIKLGKAEISIRVWKGKPYNSKQLEIFRYDCTHKIGLQKVTSLNNFCGIEIENAFTDSVDDTYTYLEKGLIAKNDGLGINDFNDWFKGYEKLHTGTKLNSPMALIHFTEFRYN